MRSKICFVSDRVFPFYNGGYEISIYNIATRLAIKYDVTIFTSMDSNVMEINKIKYLKIANIRAYINSKNIHSIKDAILFDKDLICNIELLDKCNVLFINTIPYLGYGLVMKYAKRKYPNVRIFSIFHEAWHDYFKTMNTMIGKILHHEISSIVANSDKIIARSKVTRDSLMKNYFAKNITVIPDGIDPAFIDKVMPFADNYDVIYVGRLSIIKHVEDIVYATSIIVNSITNIRVLIVGDGELRQDINRLIRDKHLENNIFMTGFVPESKKYELMKASKIFVMPSEREGFCISALEAMYCGCVPIIARPVYNEVFGSSDFVKDGKTGLHFKFHDFNDLADKIKLLNKDKDLYKMLQTEAKAISSLYTWENATSLYESIFSKAVLDIS